MKKSFPKWLTNFALVNMLLIGTLTCSFAKGYGTDQKVKLTEVLSRLTKKYQVYFTYDKALVDHVKVDYSNSGQTFDAELSSALSNTDLKFRVFDSRFVIIYKSDAAGLESLRKMVDQFTSIIAEQSVSGQQIKNAQLLNILQSRIESQRNIADDFQIKGTIADEKGQALVGVSVRVKNKPTGTVTDIDGKFALNIAHENEMLVLTYIGYLKQEIAIGSKRDFVIVLKEDQLALSEVVVVGYGTQRKTSLTASVSTVKGSDIAEQPVSDLSNALGGRATGVLFTQSSGQAGNDAATIMIRGVGTSGNSSPLYIVDGIPRNFSQLNPADIESITVLKDAAAIAPYGMGGANGVILVTTKKGKTGKPHLSYDGYVGFQNPTVTSQFISSYDYAVMKNAGVTNQGGANLPFSPDDLQKYKDHSDPDGHPNVRNYEDLFLKNTIQTGHNLTLSGGTEIVKYSMGLGYFNQQGLLPKLRYQRFNMSANMQAQATKSTLVSLSLNGRVENRNLTSDGYNDQSLFEGLIYASPQSQSVPYIFSNGYHTDRYAKFYDNPSYKKAVGNTMLTQFSIEQQLPLKGLSLKAAVSYDYNPFDPYSKNNGIESVSKTWNAPYSYYTLDKTQTPYAYIKQTSPGQPSLTEVFHQTQAFTYQGYLNYAGNFGKNAVSGLLVLEARNTKSAFHTAGRINYNIPIDELFAGGTSNQISDGNSLQTKQRSFVYRVTYGFDNKYLFEAAGRYDGNYIFAPGNRFGFFPAFSAGWRISEENFLKDVSWLDELKIRGSWGKSGQIKDIAAFQYQSGFNLNGASAVLNGVLTQGLNELPEANTSITWEKATKTNIGFEANILRNAIHIEADYFNENRDGMLVAPNVTVPLEYGVGLRQVNAGSMKNRGFEFSLDAQHSFSKDLKVSFNANFTYAKNKLTQVFESPSSYNIPGLRRTGRPLGTTFGYKSLGLFQTSDFEANGSLKPGIAQQTWSTLAPGEIRYADLGGPDGKPDGKIDIYDQMPLGAPEYPAIVYGLSPSITYKGFGLSLLFQGTAQRSIQLTEDAAYTFFNNGATAYITSLDYWTPENPNASNPRILPSPSANTKQPSTFWQRDASYLRLRTANLSYTLPSKASKVVGASLIKVYMSGQNILTWTKLKNFDPEVAHSFSGSLNYDGGQGVSQRAWYFPTQKVITFGINIQF